MCGLMYYCALNRGNLRREHQLVTNNVTRCVLVRAVSLLMCGFIVCFWGLNKGNVNMNNNILCFGYEMLLQPDSALRHKHDSKKVAVDMAKVKAAQRQFFGLEKLFHTNQRTK